MASKFFHDKTFRVSSCLTFNKQLPGLSASRHLLQAAPHCYGHRHSHLQSRTAAALLPGLLLGFRERDPSPTIAPRPLCPPIFMPPAKNPGALIQVRKWFSSTQSGTFSELPLPLACFPCLGRAQRAREFLSLLSVGPCVGIPTAPNI